jgi:protein required for attachment to host cells
MHKLLIPHDAMIFVGDGRKALFLRNAGDQLDLNLVVEQVFAYENPPTHLQGTDRPGRAFKRAGTNLRSSVETTDWHELEKERFAVQVAGAFEHLIRARGVKAIVVVAPPHTLAELRQAFHADVKERMIGEIGKDLTKHPVAEIERHLAAA